MAAVLRTSLIAVLCVGTAFVVYWRVSADSHHRALEEIKALQQEMEQRLAAKESMIERLNRSRRLAHIHVVDQSTGPGGEVVRSELLFVELDEKGREVARQPFSVPGDVVYVDAWSVKFHRDDVAEGHPLRGRTLLLLRRIYSDRMAPADGYPIDVPGAVPPGYTAGEVAAFEKRLWEHFWELATDPQLAATMGVRVAQGEAVYKPVRAGQVFELTVDATGGMSLVPLPPSVAVVGSERD